MSEDVVIQEKALALKSIVKELKKELKEQQKVEKVPEDKTESFHEFLKWADGKDKNKVAKKAIARLAGLIDDVKKGMNLDTRGKVDIEVEADKYEDLKELMESEEYNEDEAEDESKTEKKEEETKKD